MGRDVVRTLKGLPIRPPVLQQLKVLVVDAKMTPALLQIPQILPDFSSSSGALNYNLQGAGGHRAQEGREGKGSVTCMGHLWDALPGTTHPILATVLLKNPPFLYRPQCY